MPGWLGTLLAFAAFLALAPLVAWLGRRHGRSIKGGVALASMMLGLGPAFDPPQKALIEASEEQVKGGDETGEPPTPKPNGDPSSDG
ncbi:hypothetical protein [Phenylobacterium sp.]|uniref:hypothetical protein n=1 Tax=Phenylobacterium sp. TaxID=1871053 RepID=UPI003562A9F7